MNFLPDLVDNVYVGAAFLPVEIKTDGKKELGRLDLAPSGNERPDIHGENPDGVAASAVIKQVPGVIVRKTRQVLKSYDI